MKLKINESQLQENGLTDFLKGLGSQLTPVRAISNWLSALTGNKTVGGSGDEIYNTTNKELKGTDTEFQRLVQTLINEKAKFDIKTDINNKTIDVSFSATNVPTVIAQELDPTGEDNLYTKFYKDYNSQSKTLTLSTSTNYVESGLVSSENYVNQSLTTEQQQAIDSILDDENLDYIKELVKKENPSIGNDEVKLAIEIGKKLESLATDEDYEQLLDIVKASNPNLKSNAELGYGVAQLLDKANKQGNISKIAQEESVRVKEGNPFKSHHICKGCGNTLDKCTCSIEELDEDFGGMATQPSSIGQHHTDSIDLGFCDNNDEQVLYMDYTVKKSKKFPKEYEIYLGEDLIYSDEGSVVDGTNYIKKYLS